jgi:hypothetical protein
MGRIFFPIHPHPNLPPSRGKGCFEWRLGCIEILNGDGCAHLRFSLCEEE